MATFTVGGKQYAIPEMNVIAIERAWLDIQAATIALDPIQGAASAISVIAAALMESESFDRAEWDIPSDSLDLEVHTLLVKGIKRRLKVTEMSVIRDTMFEILKEAGLDVTEGELLQSLGGVLGVDQPLTETAPDTSVNSSPQESKEEAGTE